MLNALTVGTYVRPHRHLDKHNSEGFIVLRGSLALLIFDESGQVIPAESCLLNVANGMLGMDIAPGIWHTLVALEDAVIYEVKGHPAGGYVEELAKNFAACGYWDMPGTNPMSPMLRKGRSSSLPSVPSSPARQLMIAWAMLESTSGMSWRTLAEAVLRLIRPPELAVNKSTKPRG